MVTNKADFNKDEVFAKLNYWLEEDYSIISAEHQYHEIPRKIIIEKYLTDGHGSLPIDYKFLHQEETSFVAFRFPAEQNTAPSAFSATKNSTAFPF